MRGALLSVVALAACASAYDSEAERKVVTPVADAGSEVDSSAVAPPRRCTADVPFKAGKRVADFDTALRLSGDELTGYTAVREESYELVAVTRPTRDDVFGAPTKLATLNTAEDETTPTVTADGLAIVFTRRIGPLDLHLFRSVRFSVQAPFGPPEELPAENNLPGFNTAPYFRPDGAELYYVNWNHDALDIYVAPIVAGAVGAPAPLSTINTAKLDSKPVVSADALTMYFVSTRAAGNDAGFEDAPEHLYVATRPSVQAPFTVVREVKELSGFEPNWLSLDGCRLYYRYVDSIFVSEKAE